MIDNKTSFLKLPLPNVDNELEDDAPRLEAALKALDANAETEDTRIRGVAAQALVLEQRVTSSEETVGALTGRASAVEGRASALEADIGQTSAILQAHDTALQNCDATLRDHANDLDTLNVEKASKAEIDTVEANVTAISTMLIGTVFPHTAADSYVPNGCVPANGGEYSRSQFPSLYDTYLAGGKLITCTYAAWTAQVAQFGNCTLFALDNEAKKFKVPLIKDGDSITQALNAAEIGKSVKAALPNAKARLPWWAGGTSVADSPNTTGMAYHTPIGTGISGLYDMNGSGVTARAIEMELKRASSVYQDGVTTVLDEQVRLRHFVVVASAQNSASVFDWANYMAALAGKANTDLSNVTGNAINHYLYVCDEKSTGVPGGSATGGAWQTRNLNAVRVNRINAALDNSRITLQTGRYYIRATVPIYAVNASKVALYNYTTATYLLYSPSYYADYNNNVHSMMTLEGEFTLSAIAALELRMWVQSSYASGMGVPCNISGVSEVYSEVHIWKM